MLTQSDLHFQQIILLLTCLDWLWQDRNDYYASANITIYYHVGQLTKKDFSGPDFFVVLNTEKRPRKNWVVWQEDGKYPNVVIDILPDSPANVDLTSKKALYQNTFRVLDYFWFEPNSLEFQGFTLLRGQYEPITPSEQGWLWSEQLGLYLGVFSGKLRYFTPQGELVPTPQEAALRERRAKEEAQQRADQLAEKLRSLGVNPDEIG